MASWEAQKYFKQLAAGVVSDFIFSLKLYASNLSYVSVES
jgi:hypothetical protein